MKLFKVLSNDDAVHEFQLLRTKNRSLIDVYWVKLTYTEPRFGMTLSFDADSPVFVALTIWKFDLYITLFERQID